MSGAAIATGGTQDPESEFGHDQVKVFSHEGDDVENTEHLNSMDLHDVKTELEKDAEKAEVSYLCANHPRGTKSSARPTRTKLILRACDMGGFRFEPNGTRRPMCGSDRAPFTTCLRLSVRVRVAGEYWVVLHYLVSSASSSDQSNWQCSSNSFTTDE